jgi:hypothetical protein
MISFPTKLRSFPPTDETAEVISELRCERVRGIGWVFSWAAAIVVLCAVTLILFSFAYRVAAEQALARAAAEGIREAKQPRATSQTVEQTIRRELGGCYQLGCTTQIAIRCGGRPVKGIIAGSLRDQLSVSLSAPATAAFPGWLRPFWPWNADAVTVYRTG